ncbi:formylmethanofuran dehydrogenase subunit E [Pantoea sp. AN62]|uniref:hypothetical protein n=1 Tax=Pantoea sp. AN62 TaxID=2587045 RepID=UPI0015CA1C4F
MSNKLIYQGLSKEDKKVLKQAIKSGHRIEARFTDSMTPKQRKLLDQVVAERQSKIEEKKKRWLNSIEGRDWIQDKEEELVQMKIVLSALDRI